MKFAISFALYVYTIARLLEYLRLPNWGKRLIGWGVSVCVLAQMVCITIQAARGTTSHFNFTTHTDATISIIMDLMDPINGLFVVALLIFACLARYDVTRPVPLEYPIRARHFPRRLSYRSRDGRQRSPFHRRCGWRSRITSDGLEYYGRRFTDSSFCGPARSASTACRCLVDREERNLECKLAHCLRPCSCGRLRPGRSDSLSFRPFKVDLF
jgi:ATP phosphoribosyltransferase involved in histidine biosynthesis